MPKTPEQRLEETYEYIGTLNQPLLMQIRAILRGVANNEDIAGHAVQLVEAEVEVGREISLQGELGMGSILLRSGLDRTALRALLLCQRIFLSNLWSPSRGTLDAAWSRATIEFWKGRAEPEIRRAVMLYAIETPGTIAALADAAANHALSAVETQADRLTRQIHNPMCYTAVSSWLLNAGFVSMGWMTRRQPAAVIGQPAFDVSMFGNAITWIGPDYPLQPDARIIVPRGMIVFMATAARPIGHWMVSDGDGFGWGYNNSQYEPLMTGEQRNGSHGRMLLHRQFASYRTTLIGNKTERGFMHLFDPMAIPHPDGMG